MTTLEPGIITDDIDGLARFYIEGLGFAIHSDIEFRQGRVLRMRCGDAQLKLFRPASSPTTPRNPPWHATRGFAYTALHVDDADSVLAGAVAAGATVLTPVTAHRPGARFALVADPEGNVWEILEDTGVGGASS